MKDHGLLFTAPMVRALLAGSKTQTRRLVKAPKDFEIDAPIGLQVRCVKNHGDEGDSELDYRDISAPHGPVGRIVYAKETWHQCPHCDRVVSYRAGGWMDTVNADDRSDEDDRPLSAKCTAHGWRSPIHMPRWAARLWFEVTRVRLERVQAITEDDARAEGMDWAAPLFPKVDRRRKFEDDREDPREVGYSTGSFALQNYRTLWDEINGAGSWASNPWVWVYDLKRIAKPALVTP